MKYTTKKKVKAKKYNKLVDEYNHIDQRCKDMKQEIASLKAALNFHRRDFWNDKITTEIEMLLIGVQEIKCNDNGVYVGHSRYHTNIPKTVPYEKALQTVLDIIKLETPDLIVKEIHAAMIGTRNGWAFEMEWESKTLDFSPRAYGLPMSRELFVCDYIEKHENEYKHRFSKWDDEIDEQIRTLEQENEDLRKTLNYYKNYYKKASEPFSEDEETQKQFAEFQHTLSQKETLKKNIARHNFDVEQCFEGYPWGKEFEADLKSWVSCGKCSQNEYTADFADLPEFKDGETLFSDEVEQHLIGFIQKHYIRFNGTVPKSNLLKEIRSKGYSPSMFDNAVLELDKDLFELNVYAEKQTARQNLTTSRAEEESD